jgi:hypothetical protein
MWFCRNVINLSRFIPIFIYVHMGRLWAILSRDDDRLGTSHGRSVPTSIWLVYLSSTESSSFISPLDFFHQNTSYIAQKSYCDESRVLKVF